MGSKIVCAFNLAWFQLVTLWLLGYYIKGRDTSNVDAWWVIVYLMCYLAVSNLIGFYVSDMLNKITSYIIRVTSRNNTT